MTYLRLFRSMGIKGCLERHNNFLKEEFMARGKVKWWDESKGHGFITLQDGQDVFVSYLAIQGDGYKTLEEGQSVELEVVQDKDMRLNATHVRKPGSPLDAKLRPHDPPTTHVQIFQENSVGDLEFSINYDARISGYKIISASMTNPDENGKVSAIVVFDRQLRNG